jgi:hypothetical protein
MPVEIQSQEHGPLTGTATYQFKMIKEPILLDPGRMHKEQAIVPDSFDFGYHVDFPLRAYAVDARGRKVWGEAGPVVRMVVGGGSCPNGFSANLWDPLTVVSIPPALSPGGRSG